MYEGIIKIDRDTRLRVEPDTDAENPLNWGWGTEIHEIDNYRIWMGWEREPLDDLVNMARELQCLVRKGKLTEEKRDRALHLYMVYKGDTRAFEIREWRGYSKGDWATHLVLWDAEKGANVYETYAAWLRGDVFGVILETWVGYANMNDPDDIHYEWDEQEALWGCYLDDKYTAEDVARENGWIE